MLPPGAPGEADEHAPGVHIPVGRPQPREGGYQVHAPVVGRLPGVVLRVPAVGEKAQLVPQPLDHRAPHEHRALQGILHLAVEAHGNGGQQAVAALTGDFPGVHQQEAAGAVGVLGVAGGEAALAEEGGLLVAGHARDGDAYPLYVGIAVDLAGGAHLRQHGAGNVQSLQQGVVPVQSVDVKEHGAGGVGHIGDVNRPAGELPHQPAVHRAEEHLPPRRLLPRPLHVIQQPLELGGGEVCVGEQAGDGPDVLLQPVGAELIHQLRRAAALPHDGVVQGPAGGPVPQDGGLPLVGDADGGNLRRLHPRPGDGLHHHAVLGRPDLHGVLLYPALPGVVLGQLLLGHAQDVLLPVEENGPGAGGALIQGQNVLAHITRLLMERCCEG